MHEYRLDVLFVAEEYVADAGENRWHRRDEYDYTATCTFRAIDDADAGEHATVFLKVLREQLEQPGNVARQELRIRMHQANVYRLLQDRSFPISFGRN